MRRLSFPTACALLTLAFAGMATPIPAFGQTSAPVPVPAQATVAPVVTAAPADSMAPAATQVPGPGDAAPPVNTIAGQSPPPSSTVPTVRWLELVGHGYGHGRGLGQWGAFGYATEQGWTYDRILGHFYGGTGPGHVSPQSSLGVRLTNMDDKVLTVYQPTGRLWTALNGQNGLTPPPSLGQPQVTLAPVSDNGTGSALPVPVAAAVAGATVPTGTPGSGTQPSTASPSSTPSNPSAGAPIVATPGQPAAVRVELVSPGRFAISDGPGCAGPWTLRATVDSVSVQVSLGPDPITDPDSPAQMLSICQGASTRRVYRGDLVTLDAKPGQRTVNQVSLEDYVRGVVPGEVPSGWGAKPGGMEVLKAQAVAARSYSAAERRNGFSNTCDSDTCQVYRGRGEYRSGGFVSFEDVKTDKAVRDTAGEVRVDPTSGAVIRTEFSSSTGGQSAPGDFPPVVDEGDATSANPYRTWNVSLSPAKLEAGRKLGSFRGIDITKRDGIGQYGGRVQNLRLVFSQGSVAMTSGEFLRKFGLRSTLFDAQVVERAVGDGPAAPSSDPSSDGTSTSPDTAVAAAAANGPATATLPGSTSATPSTTKVVAKKKTVSKPTTTVVTTQPGNVVVAASGASTAARVQVAGRPQTAVQVVVPATTARPSATLAKRKT